MAEAAIIIELISRELRQLSLGDLYLSSKYSKCETKEPICSTYQNVLYIL